MANPKGIEMTEKDPVCGMEVNPGQAAAQRSYHGKMYYFCSPGCAARFDATPERYHAAGASKNIFKKIFAKK